MFEACGCGHLRLVHGDRRSGLLGRTLSLWSGACAACDCNRFRVPGKFDTTNWPYELAYGLVVMLAICAFLAALPFLLLVAWLRGGEI